MSNIGTTLLIESVAEAMKEWESRSKVDWTRQPHESVKLLRSADKRGAAGENFVKKLLEKNGIAPVIWHRRKSAQGDLPYDLEAGQDKYKLEVKLATLGSTGKNFQHERITKTGFDILILVDITPSEIYVTAIPKNLLDYRAGRGMHHRTNSGDYKFDLTLEQLRSGEVKKGCKPPHWNNCRRIETPADFLQIYENAVARLRRRMR